MATAAGKLSREEIIRIISSMFNVDISQQGPGGAWLDFAGREIFGTLTREDTLVACHKAIREYGGSPGMKRGKSPKASKKKRNRLKEESNHHLWCRQAVVAKYRLAEQIGEVAKMTIFQGILDAGCSVGDFTAFLAQYYPDAEVAGVDISQERLDEAAAFARKAGVKVALQKASVTDLPFAGGSFDLVFSNRCVNYASDKNGAFIEFWRVLRAGGALVFTYIFEGPRDIDMIFANLLLVGFKPVGRRLSDKEVIIVGLKSES